MKITKLFLLFLLIISNLNVLKCMNGYQSLIENTILNLETKTLDISTLNLNQKNFEENLYQMIINNDINTLKLSANQLLDFPPILMQLFLEKKSSLRTLETSLPKNIDLNQQQTIDQLNWLKEEIMNHVQNDINLNFNISVVWADTENANYLPKYGAFAKSPKKTLTDWNNDKETLKIKIGKFTIYIKEEPAKKPQKKCRCIDIFVFSYGICYGIYSGISNIFHH